MSQLATMKVDFEDVSGKMNQIADIISDLDADMVSVKAAVDASLEEADAPFVRSLESIVTRELMNIRDLTETIDSIRHALDSWSSLVEEASDNSSLSQYL